MAKTSAPLVDRVIGYFNPAAGLKRQRFRLAQRAYEGAAIGRRASSWNAWHTAANAEIMYAIRPLRDRSRELVRNTPHAARMLDILTAHTVGTGIVPVSSTGKDKIDNQVNQLWEDWAHECDITGMMNFYAMQALAVRSMVESGEVVFRLVDQPLDDDGTAGKPAVVPTYLQLLEADYIDQFRDGIYGDQGLVDIGKLEAKAATHLKRSRLGVGLGEYDRFVGLWLFRNHPGELNTIWQLPYISDFIGREHLIHMFKVLRPGQVRGVPWMAPILTQGRDLSDFLDAVNVKAKVEACFTAFIENDDTSDGALFDPTQPGIMQTADWANPGANVTSLEPGMIKELRAGQAIKFAQPTTNTQVEPILLFNLQAMAAGVGCTYDQITGDLRQANYSSLRAGKLDFWRLVKQLQQHTVVPKLCKPVWDRFISRAILAGRLKPGRYPVDWVVPAVEYIDPKKDADAEKNEVRAGRVTPQAYIAARGGNWRQDLKDFSDFFKKAHELDVVLDIDVGKVDQHGRQPTKGKPEETDEDGNPIIDGVSTKDSGDDDDERGGSAVVIPFFDARGEWVRYSPDQPRDEDGKWTDAGGGDDASGKEIPPPPPASDVEAHAKWVKDNIAPKGPFAHTLGLDQNIKDWTPEAHLAAAKAAGVIDKSGFPAKDKTATESFEFVSPNVGAISFTTAAQELNSDRQRALLVASDEVDKSLGFPGANISIIGAWSDGAENSVMDAHPGGTWDQLVLSASIKGWLADQKSVLVFQSKDDGKQALAQFEAKGNLNDIHENLLKQGIAFHTIMPYEGGARVYVALTDPDTVEAQLDALGKVAESYDSTVKIAHGRAEFIPIGGVPEEGSDREQRDAARKAYEEDIRKSPLPDAKKIFDALRDRWGTALDRNDTQAVERTQAEARALAQSMGFNPDNVTVTDKPEIFKVGGKMYSTSGAYNVQTGKIVLHTPGIGVGELRGLLSHEIEHHKYRTVRVSEALYTGLATPVSDYIRDNGKQLREEDGVTAYSEQYWEAASKAFEAPATAVNETLAEIANLRALGEHDKTHQQTKEPAKVWNDLFDLIDKEYKHDKA